MVISLQRGHKPEEAVCFKLHLQDDKSHQELWTVLAKSWHKSGFTPTSSK